MPTFRGNETAPMQLLHFFCYRFYCFWIYVCSQIYLQTHFSMILFPMQLWYLLCVSQELRMVLPIGVLVFSAFFREHFLIVSCVSSVFGVHFDQVFIGLFRKSRFVAFECLYE